MNKKSFTMADRRSSRFYISNIQRKAVAFTMAEILLSLTIIGVVAAITLPSLTGNINERTWNTQRKALYARMSQAIALMGSLNGYGIGATEEQTASNATKVFVTNGLAKVYKINNICDAEHISDCGIASAYAKNITNSKVTVPKNIVELNRLFNVDSYTGDGGHVYYSQINTYTTAFETQNGESVLAYYNPFCTDRPVSPANSYHFNLLQPTMCINFIYDLNGKKGPNAIGKDAGFITVFNPTDSIVVAVSPVKSINDATTFNFDKACRNKLKNDEVKSANIYELASVFVNQKFTDFHTSYVQQQGLMSSTKFDDTKYKAIGFYSGSILNLTGIGASYRNIYCIKRNN